MKNLQQKVVVITGPAGGLGSALAKEFHKKGCHLALIDTDIAGLQKLAEELDTGEQQITIHQADISEEQQVAAVRQVIIMKHERVDILINNAAISASRPFDQLENSQFRKLFDVNFWGTVYCTRHFLPDLLQQPGSMLVNIISGFALMGFPGKTAYCSSKSAVMGFTNALHTELAGTGVQTCLVIPPPLDTGLVRNNPHTSDVKKEREIAFLRKNGMPPEKAAARILAGIGRRKYRIVVGAMMYWTDIASRLFPVAMHRMIGKSRKRFDFI